MFMRMVWALGTETPPDGGDPVKHEYNNRGSKSVLLLSSPTTENHRLPSDATVITLAARNVEVREAVESLYYIHMPIPEVNKKRHLVMWSPRVQPGNEDIVHHIVCFLCYKTSTDPAPPWQGYSDERPRKLSCNNHIMAWSVGGGDVWLPDEAGIVIGGPETKDNKLEYLRMEIFYHNPKKLRGRIDSTSVQLWVTETLRSNDAGVFLAGATESTSNFLIPPRSPHFIVDGYCPSECLQQGFLGRDVKIPMVMLHSHLTGTTLVVRHVRNGIELPYIAKEHYADFEFQDFRRVPDPPTVKNTDDIIVECSFDTMHKTGFSSGGWSVEDEYCLAIMLYYPRGSLSWCASQPTDAQMLKFLNLEVQSGKVTTEGQYKGMTPIQVLNEQNWNAPGMRQRFENSIREGEMRLSCYREHWNGTRLPAHGQYRTLALPSKPYTEPPAPECPGQTSPASSVNVTMLPVVTFILWVSLML